MIELQCAGFVTTTDACCGLGKYGGLFYSCVFFHGWRAATHRAMSGGMNSTRQMLWTESWQIMCGPVSTPRCAIQWTCRRW